MAYKREWSEFVILLPSKIKCICLKCDDRTDTHVAIIWVTLSSICQYVSALSLSPPAVPFDWHQALMNCHILKLPSFIWFSELITFISEKACEEKANFLKSQTENSSKSLLKRPLGNCNIISFFTNISSSPNILCFFFFFFQSWKTGLKRIVLLKPLLTQLTGDH